MKQIFTLFLSLMVISGVQAQFTKPAANLRTPNIQPINADDFQPLTTRSDTRAAGDTIWYEDFSDSTAVMTSFTFNDSTSNNFNFMWVSTGLSGAAYTSVGEMSINSPTGTNGYMLLPADWYNSDHNGNMTTQINMKASMKTPAIDCSGKSSVILRLYEKFRFCCSSTSFYVRVDVSNNGNTWTSYDLKKETQVNSATPNPLMMEFNISAVAANQPTVYIRISYGGASHYFMCVDDILLYEGAPYDLRLDRTLPSYFFIADLPILSKVPMTVLNCEEAYGLIYAGALYNMGNTANAPVLNAKARHLGDNVLDFEDNTTVLISENATIPPAGIDTAYTENTFYPDRKGDFRLIFDFEGTGPDFTPLNNIDSSYTLNVNDTVLALYRSTLSTTKGYSVANERSPVQAVDGDIIGQYLYLPCPDTISSISFYPLRKVGNMSDMPIICFAVLYQYVGGQWILVDESQPIDLTGTTHFNKWQTAYFASDLVLEAGNYIWGIAVYGGSLFISIDAVSYQPRATNFIFMADEAQWYYILDGTCGMNLNFYRSGIQGINEATASQFELNCYPNPSSTVTNFDFELSKTSDVAIQIMDITGKVVIAVNYEDLNAGKQTIDMNVRNLQQGMYFYNFTVDGITSTGKLNITK
jgi:hypothetical protein